jgi:uncharacterized protein YjbI with pentapeptide repeats
MPDRAHLTILKQGVNSWNEWRTAHPQMRPELANAHLYGLDLVDANLTGADLRHADLRGTNLTGSVLVGANLEGADFFRTVLDGTDLNGANLMGARNLNCLQLEAARNWQSAFRDYGLACGATIPVGHSHP